MVAIDAVLKACAWDFLKGRGPVGLASWPIRLGYVENGTGFGFDQSRLLARCGVVADDGFIVCTLAVFLALAFLIFRWNRIRAPAWIKILLAVVAYFIVGSIALAFHDAVRLTLLPYLRGLLRVLGPLAVALALYGVTTKPYNAAMSAVLLAGTIGNCASLLLPPFAAIDFFGIYRPSLGFFIYANTADAYLAAALAMLVARPIMLLVRQAVRRRRESAPGPILKSRE